MATQIWDSSYENIPADNDQASEGALRIRNLKRDIRERAEIDHDWDDVTDSGKHTQVTFVDPLGADPSDVTDEGMLYTKNVSAKAELFWKDEDGNVIQLTTAGKILEASLEAKAFFPATTRMLFQQAAAPTGWTKDVTAGLDDHALRVVTTTSFTAGSNGTNAFSVALSTAFASAGYQLVAADIPALTGTSSSAGAHGHSFTYETASGGATLNIALGSSAFTTGTNGTVILSAGAHTHTTPVNAGGGQTHAHNVDLDVKYLDSIVASKD